MAIEGLDLETLLTPISAETPTGTDIRTDFTPASVYFRLRDARADARAAERAADTDPAAEGTSTESWRTVRSLSVKILSEQAKDLEVAAWLTEALVRSNGLSGLAFGAQVIGGLADRYWDQLYPMPDEDGMETRLAPVTGLNGEGGDGTLTQPLNKLRLFNTADGEPVLLFRYRASAELETITDKARKETRLKAGVMPFDKMQAAARAAGAANFVGLRRALREAQSAWTSMGEILDRVAGRDAPPTRQVSDTLDSILSILNQYAPPEVADAPAADADAGEAETGGGGGGEAADESGGQMVRKKKMVTREDALASLTEIAEFFRRTEPQSPLAYTIDEAIRRGRLSWPELLGELVSDANVRNNILNSLGIKPV
jgi:type VI secretion system protein ImpA